MHNIYILRGNNAELFDSKQKALNAAQQLIDILIDNGDRDLLRDEGQVYQGYRDDKLYAGLEIGQPLRTKVQSLHVLVTLVQLT